MKQRCHICMHPFDRHWDQRHEPETVEQTVERVLREREGETLAQSLRRINAKTVRLARERHPPGTTRIVC